MGKYDYNVIVIGGGSAGLVSALIASTVKAKVALIEANKMGGDCLNTGCVPSKALIKTAKFVHDMKRHEQLGIESVDFKLNFKQIAARIKDIIKSIEPNDSPERYAKLGVDVFQDKATFIDKNSVSVNGQTLTGKNLILGLGAEPFIPPIKGLENINYLTSDNLWDLEYLPPRMIVVGGGPIGCEMAQAFSRLGSKVTQIDMSSHILPREDDDIAAIIQSKMISEGVDMQLNSLAEEIIVDENGSKHLVVGKIGVSEKTFIPFDEILIAAGRRPRTSQLPLDALGIKLDQRDHVIVDDYLCANKAKNIYCAGDIIGPYQFTHMASHQAYYATVNALFRPMRLKVDYSVVPWVTYTAPEIARVGLNESEAKREGIKHEVFKFPIAELDRAKTESETDGIVKVITHKGNILGSTIVSHNAGEMNTEFITAMKFELTLNDILGTIHPYPTWSEANKFVAGAWKKSTVKNWVMNSLLKFHRWKQ